MNFLYSRKGQGLDIMAVSIFLLVFGILTLIAYKLMLGIIDGFTSAGLYTGVMAETGNKFLAALRFFDLIIVLIAALLIIGLAITSFRLRTTPLGFIVTFIAAAFYGYISYYLNYIFIQIAGDQAFNTIIGLFPKTMILATNLHWIALVSIIVVSVGLFAKKPSEVELVGE